jgi:hypothetical protein
MRLRFTIRDLLWLTTLLATGLGWIFDPRTQTRRCSELEESTEFLRFVEQGQEYEKRIAELQVTIAELKQKLSTSVAGH